MKIIIQKILKIITNPEFKYAAIAFIGGFVLMAVEIIASRVVAPIIGSSLYSWTAIIGVILFGISIGNYSGGKLIDNNPKPEILAYSLLAAAISIAIIPSLVFIVEPLVFLGMNLLITVSVIAVVLFLLPAILLGTIFPSIIKLSMHQLITVGESAGLLSGLGALGSIAGTFFTGFFLIGFVGTSFSLFALALVLVISSWVFDKNIKNIAAVLIIILMLTVARAYREGNNKNIIFKTESGYYNIKIVNAKYNDVDTKMLFLNLDGHSIEGVAGKKIGTYQEISSIFTAFTKNLQNILVIGGGSYQMPKDMARLYGTNVTVIEIDPAVTDVANKFFNAGAYPIRTVNTDGRLFLKTNKEKFDVIFADAFNSFISIPWYMATKESLELSRQALSENGIFALNIISSVDGQYSKLYQSVLKTFASVFTNYHVLYLGKNKESIQNIILVGINSEENIDEAQLLKDITAFGAEGSGKIHIGYINRPNQDDNAIILKDDFAPIERLTMSLTNAYIYPYSMWVYSILRQ